MTENTAPTLTIEQGDTIPETTRATAPNPFAQHFPTPEGKTVIVTLPSETEDEKKYIESVVKKAQNAGKEVRTDEYPEGTTTRVFREEVNVGTDKKPRVGTRLTMWSVPPIKRPRNGEQPDTGTN